MWRKSSRSGPVTANDWKGLSRPRLDCAKDTAQERQARLLGYTNDYGHRLTWILLKSSISSHTLSNTPIPINRSNCSSTCPGSGPPVTRSPSSMLMVKAYSVRLALDRNSQRPSATAHLTCRMPCLPPSVMCPLFFGPVVHRRNCRHLIPKGLDRVVFRLTFDLVRCFHDHVDPHATMGSTYQCLADAGDSVDGVADQGDASELRNPRLEGSPARCGETARHPLRPRPHKLH